jgi:hypothetical protein
MSFRHVRGFDGNALEYIPSDSVPENPEVDRTITSDFLTHDTRRATSTNTYVPFPNGLTLCQLRKSCQYVNHWKL